MRRFTMLALCILALASFTATTAWAQNPHFIGKAATATLSGNNVQVCWKESGLGSNVSISYEASGSGTADYVCVNSGGQCPNAANKAHVNGPVSAAGTFSSGKNGTIEQCLTITPPSAGSFSCPSGQSLVLADVSYTGLQITDQTTNPPTGITQSAKPSSLGATNFTCP